MFGVRAPGEPVSHLIYLGLFALQHRGQESAGIAVSDGQRTWVAKGMGLVPAVFTDHDLASLTGYAGIGHTRYSTTGSSEWRNAQPILRGIGDHQFALAHNGNLVNTMALVEEAGLGPDAAISDSDVMADLLVAELGTGEQTDDGDDRLEEALLKVLPRLRGAFSLVIMDEDRIIGVRDPNGFRPLMLGQLPGGGWVLASETPALDVASARPIREIEPGEMVIIDADGVRSVRFAPAVPRTLCSMEFVYLARPDGVLAGTGINGARIRMGERLARQAPVEADLVVPIPESGIPGAQGYARESGIPYADAFIKNRYIGRTFIAPTQTLREAAVKIKLNPIRENVEGKRLIVVEDSIVRATTLRQTMIMLREAGALEIHLRICSPPYRWPCFYGIDTGDRSTLIASSRNTEQVREYLGADSLAHLELDQMLGAISAEPGGFCSACFTGSYPVPITLNATDQNTGDDLTPDQEPATLS